MVRSFVVSQIRTGAPRTELPSVQAQVERVLDWSGEDADRQARIVRVLSRPLVRRSSKIIWYSVSVQLAAGPVQPSEVSGQPDDLSVSCQDRLEDARCQ